MCTDKGQLVFEVQPARAALRAGVILAVLAPFLFFSGVRAEWRILGPIVFAIGIGGICKGVFLWRRAIRCYSNGVENRGRFYSYADLEVMEVRIGAAKSTRHYKFALNGRNSDGPFTVRFGWQIRGSHCPKADHLIKAATGFLAPRIAAELRNRGWVRFGIHTILGTRTLIAENTRGEIAYDDLTEARIYQGLWTGTLVIRGKDGFQTRVRTTEANFFPGYHLLIDKLPASAKPSIAEADDFFTAPRRVGLICAAGMFLLAVVMLAFPLVVDVDRLGLIFVFFFAGLCALLGIMCACCSRSATE
jgi:hypothetical protein